MRSVLSIAVVAVICVFGIVGAVAPLLRWNRRLGMFCLSQAALLIMVVGSIRMMAGGDWYVLALAVPMWGALILSATTDSLQRKSAARVRVRVTT